MTTTLCGQNAFAVRQALDHIKTAFLAAHSANAVEQYDGADVSATQLRSIVSSMNLFATDRLVIVRQPSASSELFAELGEVINGVAQGTTLVVVEGVLDKRTKTYKILKKDTDFKEFGVLGAAELQKWVTTQAQAVQAAISPAAVKTLLAAVGTDQWQLHGEIAKLAAFDPVITEEAIRRLVAPNLETSAFTLLDAVMAGDIVQSQELFARLKARSDPYELFGLLAWQVQALAVVAAAPRGMATAEVAAASGLKPFAVQKSQGLARRLGITKVRAMLKTLATLDMQLKSSGVAPWLLMEQALAKITSSK